MTVAIQQTIQATTVSATSLLLPSWSIVAGEWLGVGVALRDDTVVPTVSGHGLTWTQQLVRIGTDGQNAVYFFRAQAAVNATGQITISLPSNADPVGACGIRIDGQIQGSDGLDAIDASNTNASPLADNDDFKIDVTSVADNCLLFGWGTFRLGVFTAPVGQTILQAVNVGSSGDTTRSALWRLNGLKTPAGLQTLGADNSLDSARDWCNVALSIKPFVATPPTVDAGGPYAGIVSTPIALNATVTPGTDPTPVLAWTIDAGGTGTFLPSAAIEDPTFTPDAVSLYTLRLTATPSDGPPVFDTASLDSQAAPVVGGGGSPASALGPMLGF